MKKVYQKYVALLNHFLSNKFAEKFLGNCYRSIEELPIFYWNKVQETGNLAYLIRTKNIHIGKKKINSIKGFALKKLWKDLTNEYISRFGFSDNFIEITRKQKEIIRLKVDRAINEDRSLNAFIKIAEDELQELQKSGISGEFWELKGALDRAGFDIRPMETSVSEFYTHVRTLMKQSKSKEKYNG